MEILAPIALFVYNRPEHTLKTINALKANHLAKESVLYIFADGLKDENEIENIQKVHSILATITGFKEIHIKKSNQNKGLAQSIINGVTEVVSINKKIIVLEDDIETSPGFLTYMNNALSLYEKDKQVMHVAAYLPPVKKKLPQTFFFNQASCWGWGTWDRAWAFFKNDALEIKKRIVLKEQIYKFNVDDAIDYSKQLQENIDGVINTWAVKWQAAVFLNNGLCLHPNKSLVQNIGMDWSGTHTGFMPYYYHKLLASEIIVQRIELKESVYARNAIVNFLKKQLKLHQVLLTKNEDNSFIYYNFSWKDVLAIIKCKTQNKAFYFKPIIDLNKMLLLNNVKLEKQREAAVRTLTSILKNGH